jgi:Cu/Ag efflux pump CusA
MPVDALTDLSDTQVIIYSRWDRSPDLVEAQVTYPIVTALLGAPHVKAVRGFSDFGYSYVYAIFDEGTDIYWAARAARNARARWRVSARRQDRLGPDATGVGWVFSMRWWTPLESTARRICVSTRTGICHQSPCAGWPRSRPSAASRRNTR